MRYTAPPPRSSTGRTKTEQVVLEFLYKAAELIVQSRVNFHAEPDLRLGSRRARFNLDIEEVQGVRDAMTAWKEDVTLPLAISIFWDAGSHKVLLERWSITFAIDGASAPAYLSSTQDVIHQLKEVCKRISVLLRALFSFMRQLPAHRLFTQSYPSMLSYTMHATAARDAMRAFEPQRVATSGYSFIPIATPCGRLQVSAVYRRDCDRFTENQEVKGPSRMLHDNFIIQDYVPGSPDVASASAPVTSAARMSPPTSEPEARTGSFVPVSDAPLLSGDHRRSSPRSIPASAQQQSSSCRFNDCQADDKKVQRLPGLSKPMAIPRMSSKGGPAVAANRETDAISQHAHSYGGEKDTRLQSAIANPNVAAAPYGYGNVAIERDLDHDHSSLPSLAFQHRQQQLWEGHAERQNTEIGPHLSPQASDDTPMHLDSSTSSATYQCMSTPPRHPKTVALLRHGSPALVHKPSLEQNAVLGSFERFSLDSGLPSIVKEHGVQRRKTSFSGAFVSDSAESSPVTTCDGIQRLDDATVATIAAPETKAIVTHSRATVHLPAESLPAFTASPPFQANPSELLSMSPANACSKRQLRASASTVPTFVTTDRFQRAVHTDYGSSSARVIAVEHRSFSPDFGCGGVTTWGFSPDTPDSFGFAFANADLGTSKNRLRLSHGSADAENGSHGSQDDELDAMNFPFVISDGVSSAMTAVDSTSTEAGSRLSGASSSTTSSVGTFLCQLKNAPRLSTLSSTLAPSLSTEEGCGTKHDGAVPCMFDEELAGFRNLRDELLQML